MSYAESQNVGRPKLRRNFNALKPALVYYDTGAQIFEYLRYEKLMYFVGLPEPAHTRYVTHFWGVARHALNPRDEIGAADFSKVDDLVRHRLEKVYHETF